MNISYPFIRRPVGTALLSIGLMLLGIVAYRQLPVSSLPSIEFPVIRVSASRPGADPETMAASVAAPLERRLGAIAGVNEITSVNSLGNTRIIIQFDLSRSIDGAAQDVQAALNAAATDLPSDLPSFPTFRKANPSASPILILALTSKTISAADLYDVADSVLAQRLSQVEGVAEVSVNGAEQPAIRVRVNPTALASMGLSLEDVRTAIANANAIGPLGNFDGPGRAEIDRHQRAASDRQPIRPDRGEGRERQYRASFRHRLDRTERAQPPLRRLVQPSAVGAPGRHQAVGCQCDRHGRPHLHAAA